MSGLRAKFNEFEQILHYKMRYEFYSGFVLEFRFVKTNFVHLVGLHKLKDINLIQIYAAKKGFASQIISRIQKGDLTEEEIKTSKYFPLIKNRYEDFTFENIFCLSYTDVIIDFDITKLKQSKLVNTKFILYEKKQNGNRQLCIAGDSKNGYYPETFFFEPKDYYIKNQKHEKNK